MVQGSMWQPSGGLNSRSASLYILSLQEQKEVISGHGKHVICFEPNHVSFRKRSYILNSHLVMSDNLLNFVVISERCTLMRELVIEQLLKKCTRTQIVYIYRLVYISISPRISQQINPTMKEGVTFYLGRRNIHQIQTQNQQINIC